MRIIAGEFRGRVLKTPKGEATRPTSGLVRETLFNILAPRVAGARFLDLFAGCGSVGLEALSHGAAQATFVENAKPALACLRDNLEKLQVTERASILPLPTTRALQHLAATGANFELLFLDPPFAAVDAYLQVLTTLAGSPLLASDALLIAQHDSRVVLPEVVGRLKRSRLRVIGDNALSFYQPEAELP